MKNILRLIIVIGLSAPMYSHATSYQGTVKKVFALDGKVFIYIKNGGAISYCDQTLDYFVAWIDPETDYGKMMFSIALTSKTTETLVWARGDGICINSASGDKAEAMNAIDLKG